MKLPTIHLLPVLALLLAPVATTSLRLPPSPFFSTSASKTDLNMASPTAVTTKGVVPKIAVIGGGAAGLAAARVFSRAGWNPVVLEKGDTLGGVWNYQPKDQDHQNQDSNSGSDMSPMYRGLRTNLPKEVMAYREFPWPEEHDLASPLSTKEEEKKLEPSITDHESFVTHAKVQQYLLDYATTFELQQYVRTGCQVEQLTVLPPTPDDDDATRTSSLLPRVSGTSTSTTAPTETWPRIRLDWRCCSNSNDASDADVQHSETFDAVCVCNGHYAAPAFPNMPGLERDFKGRTMHSISYDDPADFTGLTVLCIGGRASGADLAREIAPHAQHVYLSDTIPPPIDDVVTKYNVTWVPKTVAVLPDGAIEVEDAHGAKVTPIVDVDVIIFCTGYDYSFPFVNEASNLEFSARPGKRRVTPLYEQLWHAVHPNIVFVGLPHSVIPFPAFELQSEAVLASWRGDNVDSNCDAVMSRTLPDLTTRLEQAAAAAVSGGEGKKPGTGRVQDTHYLGSAQWDYCRRMAEFAGLYDDRMRNYLATNQTIYTDSWEARRGEFPATPDVYRDVCYERDDAHQSFRSWIVPSKVQVESNGNVETIDARVPAIYEHSGGERTGDFPGQPDYYRQTQYARDPKDQSVEVLQSLISESGKVQTTQ